MADEFEKTIDEAFDLDYRYPYFSQTVEYGMQEPKAQAQEDVGLEDIGRVVKKFGLSPEETSKLIEKYKRDGDS